MTWKAKEQTQHVQSLGISGKLHLTYTNEHDTQVRARSRTHRHTNTHTHTHTHTLHVCVSRWSWWVSVWSVCFDWREAWLPSWCNRKHDGRVSQRYRFESRQGKWALFSLMPSALALFFIFLWHTHTHTHTHTHWLSVFGRPIYHGISAMIWWKFCAVDHKLKEGTCTTPMLYSGQHPAAFNRSCLLRLVKRWRYKVPIASYNRASLLRVMMQATELARLF